MSGDTARRSAYATTYSLAALLPIIMEAFLRWRRQIALAHPVLQRADPHKRRQPIDPAAIVWPRRELRADLPEQPKHSRVPRHPREHAEPAPLRAAALKLRHLGAQLQQ